LRADWLYDLHYPWLDAADAGSIACCICGGRSGTDTLLRFGLNGVEFRVVRCRGDELAYLEPRPGPRFRRQLYNHPDYYRGTDDMFGLLVDDAKSSQIARIRIAELRARAPAAGSLLDIGCGGGHLLEEAARSGFRRVAGVEYADSAIARCRERGLDVRGPEESAPLGGCSEERFDLVTLYSVLEHLDDPIGTLTGLRARLGPGSLLAIRVPDTPANGPTLSLLDHVWHFNRGSLSLALERSGLRVIELFESGRFQGIQHAGHVDSVTAVATPVEAGR
jgi:SAM-dependent methyltransferase